jgi:hypothetical protein
LSGKPAPAKEELDVDQIFPGANMVAGVLVLVIGFGFHWLGQLVSILNWDLATRIGIQEAELPPDYKVYEHAIAVADVALGWLYGLAGLGLVLDTHWGYRLAWFPGVVLVYHSVSYWFWTGNRRKAGHRLVSDAMRIGWPVANLVTGVLAVVVAWNAC